MASSSTPSKILTEAMGRRGSSFDDRQRAFVDELVERLDHADPASLGEWLLEFAGRDADRRATLTDVIGVVAGALAPMDEPPAGAAAQSAWRALVSAADRLQGSGLRALGRLSFVSDGFLAFLVDEARRQRPSPPNTCVRTTGGAGDALAALAVSRQLQDVVSGAVECAVVPTYDALYEYDWPGSHVVTHLDTPAYEIVFHLVLEHSRTSGASAESTLVAHLPDTAEPIRHRLTPGEGVVLRGRGTLHSWKALGVDESRTLIAVGFQRYG